jgi:HTH-type transcriptional regulator / antitoxin HigA
MASELETSAGPDPDQYLELVKRFPLRPIRSDDALRDAMQIVYSLIDRDERTPDEEDYLDVLSDLVEKYEHEKFGHDDHVSDAAMLRDILEEKCITPAQVAIGTGIDEATLAEVLAGKETLTRDQILVLASHFKIDPRLFDFR